MRSRNYFAVVAAILPIAGCNADVGTFTLYRNSPADASLRIHVATFDTKESEGYNRENCDQAARLFAAQPGVTVRFWCEKGRFH